MKNCWKFIFAFLGSWKTATQCGDQSYGSDQISETTGMVLSVCFLGLWLPDNLFHAIGDGLA